MLGELQRVDKDILRLSMLQVIKELHTTWERRVGFNEFKGRQVMVCEPRQKKHVSLYYVRSFVEIFSPLILIGSKISSYLISPSCFDYEVFVLAINITYK